MLEVNSISMTFSKGTANAQRALDGVSLSLAPGDFVTVIGSNGAGKSTLLHAISGVFYPDEGSITLDGRDITFMKEHRRAKMIGRLFQDPMKGAAPNLTIEENLALAYARGKGSPLRLAVCRADVERFIEALRPFGLGLENRLKEKVGLLSGGQRQAMTLLMATIVAPKLLLLDEHTAALDPAMAQTVLAITERTVREQRLTTLMITHDLRAALSLGNRTIMMDQGRILLDIKGKERERMTVDHLLSLYSQKRGHALANDRMLLA